MSKNTYVEWPTWMKKFYDGETAKRITRANIQWIVNGTRKRDAEGQLRDLCYGHMREPIPKNIDTPAGFYHNEPVHDTLENRYRAQQGQHKLESK